MSKILWSRSERGFKIGEFVDRYMHGAVIQESSLATEAAIWLGSNDGERMHLTQDFVKDELLPALEHFAKTGELP